ncbi:MAG TPA: inositol monophosphatase family protein [Actinomycetota bacterium]
MGDDAALFADELAFANDLADEAADIALTYFRTGFEVHTKPDLTPVTEADLRIESMIRDRIAERFPGDAVLGEEGGRVGDGDRLWIVDPIDGTKNFAGRIPIWATLIALAVDDRTVLGVVGAPALGERYQAVRGAGATMNGRPIGVSSVSAVRESLVLTAGVGAWVRGPHRDAFLALAAEADRVRGFGDFWGHVLVARGAAEVMMETSLRTWDWSALQVVVEEAGGRITQVDGAPLADGGSTLTTNAALHDEIVRRLASTPA